MDNSSIKRDQAEKIAKHYGQLRSQVELIGTLGSSGGSESTLTLDYFDALASQMRSVSGALGGDATLNKLYRNAPAAIAEKCASFLDHARLLFLSSNPQRNQKLVQKRDVLFADLDALLQELNRINKPKDARRQSRTTDDIAMSTAIAAIASEHAASKNSPQQQQAAGARLLSASTNNAVTVGPKSASTSGSSLSNSRVRAGTTNNVSPSTSSSNSSNSSTATAVNRSVSNGNSVGTTTATARPTANISASSSGIVSGSSSKNAAANTLHSSSPTIPKRPPPAGPKSNTGFAAPSSAASQPAASAPEKATARAPSMHALIQTADSATILKALAAEGNLDVDRLDASGRSPLMAAAMAGKDDVCVALIKRGASVNRLDKLGCSSLLMAASKGHFKTIQVLLDNGAEPAVSSESWGAGPMDYLVSFVCGPSAVPLSADKIAVISRLIDKGVDVNKGYRYGETLLMASCVIQNVELAKMLIAKPKIQIDAVNKYGESALMKAARVANVALVSLLLKAGANPELEGANGAAADLVPQTCKNRAELLVLLRPKTAAPSGRTIRRSMMVDPLKRITMQAENRDLFSMLNQLLVEAEKEERAKQQQAQRQPQGPAPAPAQPLGASMTQIRAPAEKASAPSFVPASPSKQASSSNIVLTGHRTSAKNTAATIVAPASTSALRVETEAGGGTLAPACVVEEVFEPYRSLFFKKVHYNFACWDTLTIVSILFTAKDGVHQSLTVSPDGHSLVDIAESDLLAHKQGKEKDKMLAYLQKTYPSQTWYSMDPDASPNKAFQLEMLGLEAGHSANSQAFRIAIVYCGPGQHKEEEFFQNKKGSAAFDEFLGLLGETVSLNGFSGFSGGFEDLENAENKTSLYCSFRNLEIMFHVSTLLSAEEQRRLIGNDLLLIYFTESEEPFKPLEFRGSVNSIGLVVKPKPSSSSSPGDDTVYRIGCFARSHIKEFGPSCGTDVTAAELRNVLLTKAVNGILATQKSPPFSKMIAQLYSADIANILEQALPKKAIKKKK